MPAVTIADLIRDRRLLCVRFEKDRDQARALFRRLRGDAGLGGW
jgi:hypothetical protein